MKRLGSLLFVAGLLVGSVRADEPKPDVLKAPPVREEVIYGRKFGTALTMDVLRPKGQPNGAGIIFVVSGGWYSSHDSISDNTGKDFRDKGYTVFAVVHGSNPKFTIPEILEDMHRAVRYIRTNARKYGVDPERLGITGGSAGGHLSLMQGCAGKPGDPKARDPIDRASSRVQAVACFYPPTDFLNWGETGRVMLARGGPLKIPVFGAFDFRKLDTASGALVPIKDDEEIKKIGKAISPISHVSKDDPPTLIVHGTKDELVPVQQAQAMIDALKAAGVPCELIIKEGGKHDSVIIRENMPRVVAWFDKYLAKKEKETGAK